MKKQKYINIVLMCTHTYIISKSKRDMGQQQALLLLTMDEITFPKDASIGKIMSTTTMFYTIDPFFNVVRVTPIQSAPAMWYPIRMRSPVPAPLPLEALGLIEEW